MIFGSVCSGIEAASVAWRPLGWRAAFVSEIEAFPRAVLQHRHPETPLHGDFTTIEAGRYEPIDLLVGGTPCQSFSVAGLRGGLSDERGNLALEYLRLADRLRPRWLVWENVPGVLSSNGGRDFGAILGGMVELGYGFAYRVLDAQFFGLAQRRRRVFVVGYLGDWRRAAAVLFERHGLSGNPAPSRKAREGTPLSPTLRARANSSHRVDSQAYIPDISPGLKARDYKGPSSDGDGDGATLIAHTLKGEGFDASEDGTGRGTPIVPVYFPEATDTLVGRSSRGGGQTNSPGHNADQQLVAYSIMPQNSGKDYKAHEVEVAQPVMAAGPTGGNQGGDYIVQSMGVTLHGSDGTVSAASFTDTAGSLRTKPPGSIENSSTTAVLQPIAFGWQNSGSQGDSVSEHISPTLDKSKTRAIAFALRGREGGAMPELGGDQVGAIRAASGGSSRDYVALGSTVETMYGVSHADAAQTHPDQALRALRDAVGAEAYSEWGLGVLAALWPPEVLRSEVHGRGVRRQTDDRHKLGDDALSLAKAGPAGAVQRLWEAGCVGRAPQGWRPPQRLAVELGAHLSGLSHQGASPARLLLGLWRASEGLGLLREALSALQEAWRPADREDQPARLTSAVRRLTPRECERLMGFPDDYTLIPYGSKASADFKEELAAYFHRTAQYQREIAPGHFEFDRSAFDAAWPRIAADGPRYKALGNSMAVPCMAWIGRRIQAVEALTAVSEAA